jgi:hypothetical protein
MSRYRRVEWNGTSPGHFPGRREVLPAAEAEAAISTGQATGVTVVRFFAAYAAYAPGEEAGFYDHVAERLIRLGWAEPVPVDEPAPVRASDADVDAETKAISTAPYDRMIHHAPKTKAAKT